MKRRVLFGYGLSGAVVVAVAIVIVVRPEFRPGRSDARTPATRPEFRTKAAGLHAEHDPDAVFQRAFWRRRAAADRVLHAERRDWLDEQQGVQRWQWFVALEPGAAFRRWLLEDNPFELVAAAPGAEAPRVDAAPAWFPDPATCAQLKILRARGGRFTVFLDEKHHRLFATDAGGGFVAAVR